MGVAFIDQISGLCSEVLQSKDEFGAAKIFQCLYERSGSLFAEGMPPAPGECTSVKVTPLGFTLSFNALHLHCRRHGDSDHRWLVSDRGDARPLATHAHHLAVEAFSAPFAFLEGIKYAIECCEEARNNQRDYWAAGRQAEHLDCRINDAVQVVRKLSEEERKQKERIAALTDEFFREGGGEKLAFVKHTPGDFPPAPPTDTFSIAAAAGCLKGKSGVYFLWGGNKIEYIGRADDFSRRLRVGQNHKKLRRHHRVSVVEASIPDSWRLEHYYIWRYDPPLNGTAGGSKRLKRADEVLVK